MPNEKWRYGGRGRGSVSLGNGMFQGLRRHPKNKKHISVFLTSSALSQVVVPIGPPVSRCQGFFWHSIARVFLKPRLLWHSSAQRTRQVEISGDFFSVPCNGFDPDPTGFASARDNTRVWEGKLWLWQTVEGIQSEGKASKSSCPQVLSSIWTISLGRK